MTHFLDSNVEDPKEPSFVALGSSGSDAYAGLELFPNPGVSQVTYHSDEVMATCPITGQPDFYNVWIQLRDTDFLIESKSMKLFFQNLMQLSLSTEFGIFCESLAVYLRDQVIEALNKQWYEEILGPAGESDLKEHNEDNVSIKILQKSRGGISIEAIA